jgi:hypothetical protein
MTEGASSCGVPSADRDHDDQTIPKTFFKPFFLNDNLDHTPSKYVETIEKV